MAEQGSSPAPSPPPCANGCGFFGSPSTMNMCSKCFREHQRSNPPEATPADKPSGDASTAATSGSAASSSGTAAGFSTPVLRPSAKTVESPKTLTPSGVGAQDTVCTVASPKTDAGADPTSPPPRKVQKNTSRCWSCRKKIGLTGFQCKCGYFFCGEHRYSDKHDCDFDFQATAREQLKKANPVVVAAKLDKI